MPSSKSAWDTIANYESHDIARARYTAKHGWEPNAAHARAIAAPFIQARHYYGSAAVADRAVKPLLLYYGIVSLSRGLVLFLVRKLKEEALAQSHGLSPVEWQTVTAAAKPDLTDLRITVNSSGSFVELLKATDNRSLLRAGSSAVNQKFSYGPVAPGTILTFGELLAGLPDVIDQLRHWKTPLCVPFSAKNIDGSAEADIVVPRWPGPHVDEKLVIAIVGPDYCDLVSCDEKTVVVRTKSGGKTAGIPTDLVGDHFARIGNLYLAQRYSSGANLAKIGQLFAISYVLGMLVRYHPSFWMDLVHQRIGDAAVPTIYKAIDCIETLFPRIVVDFLEE